MYKTQKTFNPLDCSLCQNYDCKYRAHYEQLYKSGFKIPIADCERIRKQKQTQQMRKGRCDFENLL